jgi:hypothetical protein
MTLRFNDDGSYAKFNPTPISFTTVPKSKPIGKRPDPLPNPIKPATPIPDEPPMESPAPQEHRFSMTCDCIECIMDKLSKGIHLA